MPRDKNFKRLVRSRARETGERYTQARESLRPARGVFPAERWERGAGGFDAAREYSERIGSASVCIVQGGRLVDAWGGFDEPMRVISLRHAFLATLFGMRRIDVRQTLASLGIGESVPPHLTEVQRTATIEHLLQCRSGITHPAEFGSTDPAELQVQDPSPGEAFFYTNWDLNALVTIWRRLTGDDVFEAIRRDIAVPLQMQDFDPASGEYIREGVSEHAAMHFDMSSRDLARFGLLWLRNGRWNGTQRVPRRWVRRSLTPFTEDNVHKQDFGFGYCWWIHAGHRLGGHPFFAALGGTGHAVFVVPSFDLVVVHRVHGWNGPVKWPDVWPLLSMVTGTMTADEVADATRDRARVLVDLRAAGPTNLEFTDEDARGVPASWRLDGDGRVSFATERHQLMPTLHLRTPGTCRLVQGFDARSLRGAQLRLSGNVRGDAVLHIGDAAGRPAAAWTRDRVDYEVPRDAGRVEIAVVLEGPGEGWVAELALEPAPTW